MNLLLKRLMSNICNFFQQFLSDVIYVLCLHSAPQKVYIQPAHRGHQSPSSISIVDRLVVDRPFHLCNGLYCAAIVRLCEYLVLYWRTLFGSYARFHLQIFFFSVLYYSADYYANNKKSVATKRRNQPTYISCTSCDQPDSIN